MNKRCTNPSCRKTFSTLNYGGQCPFCGKTYPQLASARKDGLPAPAIHGPDKPARKEKGPFVQLRIHLKDTGRKRWLPVNVSIEDVKFYLGLGEKIKAIKAFLEEIRSKGYMVGLKEAKLFVEAVESGRRPFERWIEADESKGGLPLIEPVRARGASPPQKRVSKTKQKILEKTIDDLDLTARCYNCLRRSGISTVAELVLLDKSDLALMPRMGKKSRAEITEKLRALGLTLRGGDRRRESGAKKQPKPPEDPLEGLDLDLPELDLVDWNPDIDDLKLDFDSIAEIE